MNVLVVTNAYPTDEQPIQGVFVRSQVESLRAAGVRADVEIIHGYRGKREYLRALWKMHRRVAAAHYDLCHAHYGLSGFVALTQPRVPVVVSFMGDDVFGTPDQTGSYSLGSRMVARLSRWVARRAAAVIVKSDELKAALGRDDIHVIPNGIDLQLFRPIDRVEACRRLSLDESRAHVLFTGQPALAVKDFPLAQDSFARVLAQFPGARFLEASRIPHEEMPYYYSAAEVLLLTSRHEGSPNSVKEAMACNLPVVSVDVGDVRHIVGATEGCRVVASRDPETLAATVLEILRAPRRTRGREAVAGLSLEKVAHRVLAVYESVLRARRRRRQGKRK